MGSSYVELGNTGFWERDGTLELVLRLLSLQREIALSSEPDVLRTRDRWLVTSGAEFNGCVPANLESAVVTTAGRIAVSNAAISLAKTLRECRGLLDKDTLNLLGLSGSFIHDCEVAPLPQCVEKILGLLEKYTPVAIDN